MTDLWTALSLVAVIEGLMLFAFPGIWRRAAAEMLTMPPGRLRLMGGIAMAAGVVTLYLIRGR